MYEKTLDSEILYSGRILNLRLSTVEVEGGHISKREIVEHKGAVAVVAVTDERELLMVRQFRIAIDREMLEIPAGLIEPGEDPESTALRELKEETGYTAENIRKLHTYYTSPGFTDELVHVYLATGLTPGEMDLDEGEVLEVEKYSLDEVEELLTSIDDSKTVIGLLYLLKHIEEFK